jgi:hypothetical protein
MFGPKAFRKPDDKVRNNGEGQCHNPEYREIIEIQTVFSIEGGKYVFNV